MKKYRFITIQQSIMDHIPEVFEGKPVYRIYNNKSGAQLGILSFYKPWKQYVFSSQPECVFNNSCLRDVLDFMESLPAKPEEGGEGRGISRKRKNVATGRESKMLSPIEIRRKLQAVEYELNKENFIELISLCIELADQVGYLQSQCDELLTAYDKIDSAVHKAANTASCLANGMLPD